MAGIANQVLAMLADKADRPWLLQSRIGQTGRILANWPVVEGRSWPHRPASEGSRLLSTPVSSGLAPLLWSHREAVASQPEAAKQSPILPRSTMQAHGGHAAQEGGRRILRERAELRSLVGAAHDGAATVLKSRAALPSARPASRQLPQHPRWQVQTPGSPGLRPSSANQPAARAQVASAKWALFSDVGAAGSAARRVQRDDGRGAGGAAAAAAPLHNERAGPRHRRGDERCARRMHSLVELNLRSPLGTHHCCEEDSLTRASRAPSSSPSDPHRSSVAQAARSEWRGTRRGR